MKLALVCAVAAFALSCSDSTSPQDPWVGTWHLLSVDSLSLPATDTIAVPVPGTGTFNNDPILVVYRTLDVRSGGQGIWRDSSFSAALGCGGGMGGSAGALCNSSGMAVFTWTATADTLTVTRVFATTVGYVMPVKTFVKQVDGSLLETDEYQYEVYRR